jgi:hypothetical protein
MAVSNPGLENWLDRLYNLRRDKSGSHERPHKPALLLSVIDLLDHGVIAGKSVIPPGEEKFYPALETCSGARNIWSRPTDTAIGDNGRPTGSLLPAGLTRPTRPC